MRRVLLLFTLLLYAANTVWAQTEKVSGKVLDERGEGLPGASIRVKGSQMGTVTDLEGNFSLDVPDEYDVIQIESIGYTTQEINFKSASGPLSVRLSPSATQLQETIVTANAIRREKRSLGYSTTQVTGNELTTGGNSSPINALVGKAAGVNINTSANAPGSSSRIVLRGGSSLLGNNQALIVVDGVPINNDKFATGGNIGNLSNQVDYGNRANDINPDDIESISVLKGPAATALYGSLGSNGAIMITTKKGRRKEGVTKTDIEVSSSFELSSILKLPDFQNKYGQGNIYEGIPDDRRENFSWGEEFNGQQRPWGQVIDGQQKVKPYEAQKNNVRDFFDIGKTWNNSVALNGGNEQAAYRLSLGSLNSKSVFPGKSYDKYTLGFNGNANLTNKVYTSITINYTKINSDLPGFGQNDGSVMDNLLQTPRDIPIRELRNLNDKYNAMDYVDASGAHRYGYYGAYAINPYYTLREFKNENNVDRVFGNYIVGYRITDWLKLEDRFGVDIYADRRFQSVPKFNTTAEDDPLYDGLPHVNAGLYSTDLYNVNNMFNDIMLTANKDLAKDLHMDALLGYNYSEYKRTNTYSSTNEEGGLVIPGYYNLQNSNGPALTYNTLRHVRKGGLYTDISFGYKSMIFLGLNGRVDKSSTIEKAYPYFGANASFVISELFPASLKDKIWNYSKIRIAYGSVANDANPYLNTTPYTKSLAQGNFGSTTFPFNGVPGFSYSNQIGNPNLEPEFSREFEIGTEQNFLRNRITLDFSYYNKRSENQIVPVPVATSSGFTAYVVNTGVFTNNGVELALRVVPVSTASGFRWELYGTYTKNNSRVKSIYSGTDQIIIDGFSGMSIVAAVDKPYGTFYTTGHQYSPDGKIIVDSATGIPTVSTTAQYYGSYLPDYQASWGTTLTYKGFSLNVLFDTKQGGMFYSRTRDIMSFVGTSKETENRDEQVWANSVYLGSDGQYHNNTTPYSPYTYYTSAGLRPDAENLVNATYVKLREARLSYVFPKKWFNRTFIGGASLSIYGNNLFIWTPKSNKYVDPEINSASAVNGQGFDFSAQPSLRSYGMNLKFTF